MKSHIGLEKKLKLSISTVVFHGIGSVAPRLSSSEGVVRSSHRPGPRLRQLGKESEGDESGIANTTLLAGVACNLNHRIGYFLERVRNACYFYLLSHLFTYIPFIYRFVYDLLSSFFLPFFISLCPYLYTNFYLLIRDQNNYLLSIHLSIHLCIY